MNALKESLGLALTIALVAFAATAAPFPPNRARSAKATATSEFCGQYSRYNKPMNRL